jgi:hypothetical protein
MGMAGQTAVFGEEAVPMRLAPVKITLASAVKGNPLVKIMTLHPTIFRFILAIKEFVKSKYFGM